MLRARRWSFRSDLILSSIVLLSVCCPANYRAQQAGGFPDSRSPLSQDVPPQSPNYGVWGDDQLLNQFGQPSSKGAKSVTLLDEIADAGEREAFAALFQKKNPQQRLNAAVEFIERYPQSAFLAPAYEMAAKASITLGDSKSAARYGRKALKLLPENPVLLVLLAEEETHEGNAAQATEDAIQALECLGRFSRPAIFSEKQWTSTAIQLRATSYYLLGKAATEEGLSTTGAERAQKLEEAEDFTFTSLRLDTANSTTGYLLGLIRLARGNQQGAAIALAPVYLRGGPLRESAGRRLRLIFERQPSTQQQPFDGFVKELALAAEKQLQVREPAEGRERRGGTAPAYAGSQSCQSCHPREYAGWQNTGHAKMLRAYKPENVFGDFDNGSYADESGKIVARFSHDASRHYIDIMDGSSKWHRYDVAYTIGSKWQQTYAVRLSSGEIQVIPLQYNRDQKLWVAFWKRIDAPKSPRAEVTNFPKLSLGTAYLVHCGVCHTSQLRNTNTTSPKPEDLVYAEPGINCEMCHGPSGSHVTSMRGAKPGFKPPLELQVKFGKIGSRAYVAICAQCHMQSAIWNVGPEGELNYRHSADTFYEVYPSRPYGEFALRAFHKDGRFRVVTFIVESFLRSKCYQKGGAHCGHCHDFHPSDPGNMRALKFLDNPDQMCLQCHAEYATKLETHTHHPAKSEGSRCTACHMPKIMNSVLFKTMTHQIDDIPDAEMTARFGQESSPNACLICHEGKDVAWLRKELTGWSAHAQPARGAGL